MQRKSRQHTIVLILSFIIGFLAPLVFSYNYEIPVPKIHDEFAYLLQGDTFSHARLSNPTHPMHRFFETFHVFHTPSYQAKYPPGQGLFLALGQVLHDLPAMGIWISCGLACLALAYLLTTFIPPYWALLTTLIFLFSPGIFMHWSQSYWGGYVAFAGGALFFGSVFRLAKEIKLSKVILMALGIFILSISRPAEGLLTVLITLPVLIWYWKQNDLLSENREESHSLFLTLLISAVFIIIFHLIYNNALTGNPFKYAYLNWSYKDSNIDIIRDYSGSPPLSISEKLTRVNNFFYTTYLGLILVGLVFVKEKKIVLFSVLCIIITTAFSVLFSRAWPHYLAATASLHYLLIGFVFYSLSIQKIKGHRYGKFLAHGIYLVVISFLLSPFLVIIDKGPRNTWAHARQHIHDFLAKKEPDDLVFVRYGPGHIIHEEWVFNDANIDRSEVVWARDLGTEKNKELITYFPNRKTWLLEHTQRGKVMIGYSSFTGKYQASLRVMGKLVFLGEYNSFKDAEKAVNSAAEIADNGQHADLYKLCVNR